MIYFDSCMFPVNLDQIISPEKLPEVLNSYIVYEISLASTLSQILRKALTEQVEENRRLREALRKEQSKNLGRRKDREYVQLVHMLRILFILVLLLL